MRNPETRISTGNSVENPMGAKLSRGITIHSRDFKPQAKKFTRKMEDFKFCRVCYIQEPQGMLISISQGCEDAANYKKLVGESVSFCAFQQDSFLTKKLPINSSSLIICRLLSADAVKLTWP